MWFVSPGICCWGTQFCSTLSWCHGLCSLPGSSVHRVSLAITLEWVVIPSPGDLPSPGAELSSPAWQADSSPLSYQGSPQAQSWLAAFKPHVIFLPVELFWQYEPMILAVPWVSRVRRCLFRTLFLSIVKLCWRVQWPQSPASETLVLQI